MDDFTLVGARPSAPQPAKKQPWYRGLPLGAMLVLAVIILGCLSCGLFLPRDPTYMDLANCNVAPCREFLFGTDAMGRDIFSMIWYGGRASLTIGFLGAAISTAIAALLGTLSGCAGPRLDALLMRGMEIFLSVPASAADRTLTSHSRHGLGLDAVARHRRHRLGRNRQGRPAPRCAACARANMCWPRGAWAADFSTSCGSISRRISSPRSSSWWS